MQPPKTILFLGATGGCGQAALRRSLAAGFTCIALCRNPDKLTSVLSPEIHPNLQVFKGNAHDMEAIKNCIVSPHDATSFVDFVISTIGAWFELRKMTLEDVHVCEHGMAVLLNAIKTLRTERGVSGRPRVIGQSSTGISKFGRDTPLIIYPIYKGLLSTPHQDKRALEELLFNSGEEWTVLRASFLTNGNETSGVAIKVGVEDPVSGVKSLAIGYTICREDVGRWMFDNILNCNNDKYVRKVATITY
ncbi:hypothetical protein CGCSCA4_v009373 [Colletotrichum siamense]|uniref:NAD(P)-binding domain-containing protein n=1 Tax=Colletotrichum siamense TaxID=690259 RepID=A0A9P5EVV0_COLSI|nr:uncharacterized protein CGCS363_v007660 [Colletotrichum siamense]KAF4841464.1 hypothetical protein CGCSCA4_v009373 [Colletotrichum siamense]KAF4861123.1 hypothetical protein CGCSCA2_v004878 [Colletotrichum siamense]KAF5501466.1 hypothetical protein CGCS363_v007660 [Colletotrichum siamense]